MSHVQYGHIFKRYLNAIRPAGGVINPPVPPMASFTGGFPGGRLTLTSGLPVTTANVSAAGSVFYTPFTSDEITLWDGAAWVEKTFTEQTISLASGFADATNYDVFGYLSAGALALETVAWASASARATALAILGGRYCKSGDQTRLYLGTFRTTSAMTTEDSGGGVNARDGGKRFVWNMYNRVLRGMSVFESTATWSYTSGVIRQANGQAGNLVELLIGLSLDAVQAVLFCEFRGTSNTSTSASIGIGVDSITAYSGLRVGGYENSATASACPLCAVWEGLLDPGYHYLAWCEAGTIFGTCTFVAAESVNVLGGLNGSVFA